MEFPHPGIQVWDNSNEITILRLHYLANVGGTWISEAEVDKYWANPKYIPKEIPLPHKTAEWAAKQKQGMTDPAMYEQEYEISFEAKLGTLLYQFQEEATLEQSFPIPAEWTRFMALDPHPRVPHAYVWAAIDPWNDMWVYRELWPSVCCLQNVGGKVIGDKGNTPEDDNRFTYKDYISTIQWLESPRNLHLCADGRPESALLNEPERIYKRVIDYAARSFQDAASDDKRTIQEKYEGISQELGYPFYFDDAVKDVDTGISLVNEWLKPRDVEGKDGQFVKKSKLHIFQDKCPELIHQLKSNRYESLTPLLAERKDPEGKPLKKRNHLTDCLRYICMAEPQFVGAPRRGRRQSFKPLYEGVAY